MNDSNAAEAGLNDLLEHAREAALHSYSPYSGFRVGAALKLTTGEIVTGTNVENVSYGLTICAERSALVRAVAQFGAQISIESVAVVNLNDAASPPCGACRQVLAEFSRARNAGRLPGRGRNAHHAICRLLPLGFEMKLK